jgi:penicillin-binding protein 1A
MPVVAIEDKRFYEHHGVDWYRTVAAFMNMFLSNDDNFGGSTITQQLIKNITEYDDVTVQRKLYEIFRALELEKNYTKDEIMEWYLNAVYFGHGNYGIAAAADYYYGKEVSDLTLAETASIVGITTNPSMYSPFMNPEQNKTRQEYILNEMCDQGYITRAECDAAISEELVLDNSTDDEEEEENTGAYYSYFIDALIEDVIADLQEERNVSYKTA